MLPFGFVWLILARTASVGLLTMGYVGHDAGHFALSRRAVGEQFLGPAAG